MSFSGPEILGPHNDVGKIVRWLSGPETPALRSLVEILKAPQCRISSAWDTFRLKVQHTEKFLCDIGLLGHLSPENCQLMNFYVASDQMHKSEQMLFLT